MLLGNHTRFPWISHFPIFPLLSPSASTTSSHRHMLSWQSYFPLQWENWKIRKYFQQTHTTISSNTCRHLERHSAFLPFINDVLHLKQHIFCAFNPLFVHSIPPKMCALSLIPLLLHSMLLFPTFRKMSSLLKNYKNRRMNIQTLSREEQFQKAIRCVEIGTNSLVRAGK